MEIRVDWLAFSLIAATLWGTVSIVDKVILEKYIPNPSIGVTLF
jgi:hypothetical protein